MRIEVKGRGVPIGDELRQRVERRFQNVARQVSPLATMEVELATERNPAIRASQVAEATLHLKGVTLRARSASEGTMHAVNLVAEELGRQVKRHRDKRRNRRGGRVPEPIVVSMDGLDGASMGLEPPPAEGPPPASP